MQFLVIGHDGKDEGAAERRAKSRQAHIELGDKMVADGTIWYGASLRDDDDNMIGSVFIVDFSSRKELDEWLKVEPYVTSKVWEKIEIHKAKVRDPWQFNRDKEFFESRQ
jgi:uncharacterized protein YciI